MWQAKCNKIKNVHLNALDVRMNNSDIRLNASDVSLRMNACIIALIAHC